MPEIRERDDRGLGTNGGSGGYVRLTVARAAVPGASKGEGGRVWEHVHQWDINIGSCNHLLGYLHHFNHRNRHPHSFWLESSTH